MSEALVERLNAAEIALRDDRPYAAVAIGEAADRIEALERENAECRRRNEEMDREITGLRNSYWEERKAHLAAEADKARLSEALRTFESYGCPVCSGDCASANPPVMLCPMQAARAALSGSDSGWRTMDSAPKDGTAILTYSADAASDGKPYPMLIVAWDMPWEWTIFSEDGTTQTGTDYEPTHWHPLPAAPQQGGE